ncbi:hypothetical protein PGTUg99_006852 [Puccinia graminis f. sp. tritici]|uniref:Uncharacterized protein n=1 Tax=Puccinia graminis f. sp. tritici TaxID=56615 RepID=A0A5B0QGL4_PUCGR|nr:hypothetical protein PGTUg99_006852 [Puccinia graminis f. sp. tritici]
MDRLTAGYPTTLSFKNRGSRHYTTPPYAIIHKHGHQPPVRSQLTGNSIQRLQPTTMYPHRLYPLTISPQLFCLRPNAPRPIFQCQTTNRISINLSAPFTSPNGPRDYGFWQIYRPQLNSIAFFPNGHGERKRKTAASSKAPVHRPRARKKPAGKLDVEATSEALSKQSFPVDPSGRRLALIQLFKNSTCHPQRSRQPSIGRDDEDPSTIDRARLKQLLKDAGIQHRPNAHQTTLVKLYKIHLAKDQGSNPPPLNSDDLNAAPDSLLPVIHTRQPNATQAPSIHPTSSTNQLLVTPLPTTSSLLPISHTCQPNATTQAVSIHPNLSTNPPLVTPLPSTTVSFNTPLNLPLKRSSTKRTRETIEPDEDLSADPLSLSRERLKELLKQAGIEHRPKARHTTLAKLYSNHLSQTNSTIPDHPAPTQKRLRIEPHTPGAASNSESYPLCQSTSCQKSLHAKLSQPEDHPNKSTSHHMLSLVNPVHSASTAEPESHPEGVSLPSVTQSSIILSPSTSHLMVLPAFHVPSLLLAERASSPAIFDSLADHTPEINHLPPQGANLKCTQLPQPHVVPHFAARPPQEPCNSADRPPQEPSNSADRPPQEPSSSADRPPQEPSNSDPTPRNQYALSQSSGPVKRKRAQPTWPRPSKLSTAQIQEILVEHHVHFTASDDAITLAGLYRSLIDRQRSKSMSQKRPKKNTPSLKPRQGRHRSAAKSNHSDHEDTPNQEGNPNINFVPHVAPESTSNKIPNVDRKRVRWSHPLDDSASYLNLADPIDTPRMFDHEHDCTPDRAPSSSATSSLPVQPSAAAIIPKNTPEPQITEPVNNCSTGTAPPETNIPEKERPGRSSNLPSLSAPISCSLPAQTCAAPLTPGHTATNLSSIPTQTALDNAEQGPNFNPETADRSILIKSLASLPTSEPQNTIDDRNFTPHDSTSPSPSSHQNRSTPCVVVGSSSSRTLVRLSTSPSVTWNKSVKRKYSPGTNSSPEAPCKKRQLNHPILPLKNRRSRRRSPRGTLQGGSPDSTFNFIANVSNTPVSQAITSFDASAKQDNRNPPVPAQASTSLDASANQLPITHSPTTPSSSKRKCESQQPEAPSIELPSRSPDRLKHFTASLSRERLKDLLKQAGINHRPKARQTTLAKLYSRHLAKVDSKIRKTSESTNKRLRIEPNSCSEHISPPSCPSPPLDSTSRQNAESTFCHKPVDVSPQITQSASNPLAKRKQTPPTWPRPSRISITQIQEILTEHCISFNPNDDFTTLARLYRSLIEQQRLDLPSKKRRTNSEALAASEDHTRNQRRRKSNNRQQLSRHPQVNTDTTATVPGTEPFATVYNPDIIMTIPNTDNLATVTATPNVQLHNNQPSSTSFELSRDHLFAPDRSQWISPSTLLPSTLVLETVNPGKLNQPSQYVNHSATATIPLRPDPPKTYDPRIDDEDTSLPLRRRKLRKSTCIASTSSDQDGDTNEPRQSTSYTTEPQDPPQYANPMQTSWCKQPRKPSKTIVSTVSNNEAATSDQGHQSVHHIDSAQDQSLKKSFHQEENYISVSDWDQQSETSFPQDEDFIPDQDQQSDLDYISDRDQQSETSFPQDEDFIPDQDQQSNSDYISDRDQQSETSFPKDEDFIPDQDQQRHLEWDSPDQDEQSYRQLDSPQEQHGDSHEDHFSPNRDEQSHQDLDSPQEQIINQTEEGLISDQDQQSNCDLDSPRNQSGHVPADRNSLKEKSFNLSDHQEPTADDDEYTTPELSGTLQGLGSSTSDDRASTSDSRNDVEVQSLLVPAQSKQSTQSSHSHTRTQSNQTKELPPDLPPSSRLTVAQKKEYLKHYSVRFKSRDKKARITELYDAMRTRQIAKAMQKSRNAENFPPTSPDTHHPTSKLKSKRHLRKKGKANAKADQIASIPCTSPTLLFSEGLAPSSPCSMQSVIYNSTGRPDCLSSPAPSSRMSIDNDIFTAHADCNNRSERMSLDDEPSDVFRWRTSVTSNSHCDKENVNDSGPIVLALQSYARQSTEMSKQMLNRMDGMVDRLDSVAEAVEDLNTTVQVNSNNHPLSRNSKGKGKGKDPLTGDNAMPQGGEFARLIRQHLATLLGWKGKTLPHHDEQDSRMNIDDELEDLSSDPDYPYRNGPGHPSATPKTLAIMWRMMSEAQIDSFRPDFNQPIDSPDNVHLLDLAVKTFLELVKCKEYTGIDMENVNEEIIRNAIHRHVTWRLRRRYRQENKWEPGKKAEHNKNVRRTSRLTNLRHARVEVLSNYPNLSGLIPIVQVACSDDDTDNEVAQTVQTSYSKKQPKRCIVRSIPWRHPKIAGMMVKIDQLKASIIAATPKGSSGAAPRVRRRVSSPKASELKPPSDTSKAVFSREWLENLTWHRREALNLRSKPDVKALVRELEKITC